MLGVAVGTRSFNAFAGAIDSRLAAGALSLVKLFSSIKRRLNKCSGLRAAAMAHMRLMQKIYGLTADAPLAPLGGGAVVLGAPDAGLAPVVPAGAVSEGAIALGAFLAACLSCHFS
jgi:hypothetical protein